MAKPASSAGLGNIPQLVTAAMSKGHKVSLKIKLKSEPPKTGRAKRQYGENRANQGLGLK